MSEVRALQRKIHVACRDLGLDQDARRDVQLAACGKASMKDMNARELTLVINHLKERGWSAQSKGNYRHKAAPRADLRLVHVLWKLLGNAGVLRDPTREGLNRFIRKRFEKTWEGHLPMDVDALRDHRQIADVINALKNWCRREGVELDE